MVEEWTSGKEAHEIKGLKTGEEYTLRETVAPEGYTVTSDTHFTLDKDGKVTSSDTKIKDGVLLVEDDKTSIKVSKVDIADGKELEGATIQIIDKNGKVVEEWTSGKEAHEIRGLKTGEEYTLRETVAPEGYTVTTDTKFSIDEKGNVKSSGTVSEDGTLLVEDDKTSIKVSKVDIADGKELEGATIQIIDKNGKVVEEWTSGKEAHEIRGLKTGEEYTLREKVAPEGYTVTTDTKFTIDEKGNVKSSGTVSKDGTLLVEDAKTSIKVSKVDIADGKELEGATLQIIDKNGKVVEEWVSGKEEQVITGLKTGDTYILRETVAPFGYDAITTDIQFTLDEKGNVTVTKAGTNKDGKSEAEVKDGVILVEDTAKPKLGSISVTKRVTFNGQAIKLDKTFYVALFTDEAGTKRYSDVKALEIKADSEDGTATVTFEPLPLGTYYVYEVEADGSPFVGNDMGITIKATVQNGTITLSETNLKASAVITNDYQDTPPGGYTFVEEPETETETETETEKPDLPAANTKVNSKGAKTGDTTDYMIYVFMMLAAAGCAGGALYGRKRKQKK